MYQLVMFQVLSFDWKAEGGKQKRELETGKNIGFLIPRILLGKVEGGSGERTKIYKEKFDLCILSCNKKAKVDRTEKG